MPSFTLQDIDNEIVKFLQGVWKTRTEIMNHLYVKFGGDAIAPNRLILRLNVLCQSEYIMREVSMRWPYEIVYKAKVNELV